MQRDEVYVVGVAESRHGQVPGFTAEELMVEASVKAVADAGLSIRDVDGLFATSAYYSMPTLNLAEHLGIIPRFADSSSLGGSSFVSYLGHAAAALRMGLCDVALVAYGSTQRSDGGSLVAISESSEYEIALGYRFPISAYALAAARHMAEYGTTPDQLADVAIAARSWAQLTPGAYTQDPLTRNSVRESPFVSSPLRRLDCCLVTDGGAAFVLTRGDRAVDVASVPIRVSGFGEASEHRHVGEMRDLTSTAARLSGPAAFAEADCQPDDVDLAMIYDSFTINVPMFLEDLGFCNKGEGGPFVEGGRIGPTGQLPVNTNGGGLSYTHPGMLGAFLVVEATRQLRGGCGARQVREAEVALVHGCGAALASHATAVLTR